MSPQARSTVYREFGRGGHHAQEARAAADVRARRPKAPELAADPELAGAVCEGLAMRWSPPAVGAYRRARGLMLCAETVHAARCDPAGRHGLPEAPRPTTTPQPGDWRH